MKPVASRFPEQMAQRGDPVGLDPRHPASPGGGADTQRKQTPDCLAPQNQPACHPVTFPTTLVLGIGNTLLGDEAAGPIAVGLLQFSLASSGALSFLDGGTLGFALSQPIAAHGQLIVIDAARMGTVPGTVGVFEGEAMDGQLRRLGRSVHEVGLADLLDLARLTGELPARRALVGIEPARIDWHDGLSPCVQAAMHETVARVREVLARWRRATEQGC